METTMNTQSSLAQQSVPMIDVRLVACVKTKADRPMPAKHLSISPWFRMARGAHRGDHQSLVHSLGQARPAPPGDGRGAVRTDAQPDVRCKTEGLGAARDGPDERNGRQ